MRVLYTAPYICRSLWSTSSAVNGEIDLMARAIAICDRERLPFLLTPIRPLLVTGVACVTARRPEAWIVAGVSPGYQVYQYQSDTAPCTAPLRFASFDIRIRIMRSDAGPHGSAGHHL